MSEESWDSWWDAAREYADECEFYTFVHDTWQAAWQAACAEKDAQIAGLQAQGDGGIRAMRKLVVQNTANVERIAELEDQIAQRVRERDVAHDLVEAARVRIAELEAEVANSRPIHGHHDVDDLYEGLT